ncbi:MAG: cation:proton antiporter regulatory subunit [Elusimicrobiota bacterium]
MNIFLFAIMLAVSFLAVRLGAVAFHLTGVDWQSSKFQSLSCFTGTGFTTKEAELIVSNPQRRKIASFLMISGNVGLVALIATFANSIRPVAKRIELPYLKTVVPASIYPLVNLILILFLSYLFIKISRNEKVKTRLTYFLKNIMIRRKIIKTEKFINLAYIGERHVIVKADVNKNSRLINKSIGDSALREKEITILSIEKKGQNIYSPSSDTIINGGDKITCFGKMKHIRESF